MIFLDYSIFCTDIMSVPVTATDISNITSIEIKNAEYDDLYATHNTDSDYINGTDIPDEWDFDTILHAKFDGNLIAGNMDFTLDSVSGVLIKKKKVDEFDWITLAHYPINTVEDFDIKFQDKTSWTSNDYVYAFVPILNGIEGNYNTSEVRCESERLVILDADEVWSTSITDGFCDTTRVYPNAVIETIYDKFPTVIRNTNANYDTVTLSGTWLPSRDEDGCMIVDLNNAQNYGMITAWSKKFIDFLTNDKTKLVKNFDGRQWLCFVTTAPSDTADQYFNKRIISFGVTEIGDSNSEEDLADAGLIGSDSEWW